jgi:hypothetical protein
VTPLPRSVVAHRWAYSLSIASPDAASAEAAWATGEPLIGDVFRGCRGSRATARRRRHDGAALRTGWDRDRDRRLGRCWCDGPQGSGLTIAGMGMAVLVLQTQHRCKHSSRLPEARRGLPRSLRLRFPHTRGFKSAASQRIVSTCCHAVPRLDHQHEVRTHVDSTGDLNKGQFTGQRPRGMGSQPSLCGSP